ncbi:putative transporter SEO1 [Wickerhamomyces ciferrii]|uniref:Transporter SEO1 n=1 Tax=Wickerhamomyces ciferrii (strain ATCC 14091 / BCRC 22168 / CBS 111 / JCM 3599 / NBRC 0793 / NRRL Y-1031 F-60-10) TaxID=1206466 RepID=K0KQY9_WICCF|nr:putative transporter SEO1 [Wickerhamomyces ciferrii]CCH45531.1 putative transporter SEO1 [Wickerhamomyces ciferrii]
MSRKELSQVEINDVGSIDTQNQETFNKWKFFFLNTKYDHPANKDIFEGEPYTIDTLLTYQSEQRLDKKSAPLWKKVIGFVWDPIFLPPDERKYVAKIDFFIYIYAIFACFIKYLDQTNINNAYVSGMKDDLNMYGTNDYNLLTTYFNIGYMSLSVPMAILLKYVRPSIILPTFEVLWTVIVMFMATVKNKEAVYGLRFLQGAVESSSFPGLVCLIEGLGKRQFMLNATSPISSMFAGYIQAGVYTSMNGRYGLPGWKWVFLVDGFISIPVAFLGYYCLPDFPQTSRAPWINKKDRQFALARAKSMKKVKPEPLTLKNFWEIVKSWKLWLFLATYVTVSIGSNSTSYFALYLKSLKKYSVQQINLIPTAAYAFQFIVMFLTSAISDYTGNRVSMITLCGSIGFVSCLLLSIWDIPFGLKIFAYFLGYGSSSQSIFTSWFTETFYDEPLLKTINIALGNTCVYAFNGFLPLGIYKTKDAPHFPIGYEISAMFFVIGIIFAWLFWFIVKKYNAIRSEKEKELSEEKDSIDSV